MPLLFLLLGFATRCLADTYHTPLDPNSRGGIKGVVQSSDTLQTVIAVEPTDLKAYQAKADAKTGAFTFQGLPPGEYDLLIKTVGHVYEGLTLELDAPEDPKTGDSLSRGSPESKDLADMTREVGQTFFAQEDYFNVKKIVRLAGTPASASQKGRVRLLAVQVRTKPTVDPAGEKINANIRRFDLVDLERAPGKGKVWQMVTSRHVLRQEVPFGDADNDLKHAYSPALAGVLVGEGVKDLGTIDVTKLPAGPKDAYGAAEYP